MILEVEIGLFGFDFFFGNDVSDEIYSYVIFFIRF